MPAPWPPATAVLRTVRCGRGLVVGQVDAGEPEAGGVQLGRRGELALGVPQAAQALLAGALDDSGDEGRAPLVLAAAQLEAEQAGGEALAIGGVGPPTPERLHQA